MFDPALAGYWGHRDRNKAIGTVLGIIAAHADKVDGIKVSLLDRAIECDMRRRLPKGVRMYTGDDFHYAELIGGDDQGHSDALLGIFDAIAPAASAALSGARRRGSLLIRRHSRDDRAPGAPHLRGADAVLQDRYRLHGIPDGPAGSLHHAARGMAR
jgi:hypothetical protein